MSRHSKNNTALAFFTKSEFEKLDYGTKRERLGRDSMRDFNSCFLCLQISRDPLCCTKGHLACRECIYENMFSQKVSNKRKESEYLKYLKKLEAEKDTERKKEEEQRLAKLERLQLGICRADSESELIGNFGSSEQKNEKGLPSFWVPSVIPKIEPSGVEKPDVRVYCTAVKKFHEISMKRLFPVKFTALSTLDKKDDQPFSCMCPACLRALHNGVKMAVLRECGHVMCNKCISKFVKPASKCYCCDRPCKSKDIIPLYVEGTGFSKVGNVQAQKEDVAFQ